SEAQEALQRSGDAGNITRFPAPHLVRWATSQRPPAVYIHIALLPSPLPIGRGPLRWQAASPSRLQAGANHSQQLLVVGRLLEKSDRARFEGTFFRRLGIAGRKNDHRNVLQRRILPQVFEHGKSVPRRQSEIENDQVWMFLLSHRNGGITVANINGVKVIGPQTQTQGLSE